MILVKRHDKVVAVCDSDLIGKTFDEGKCCLEVNERFYKGEEKNCDEVKKILKEADNANIVGEESVKAAMDAGVVSKEEVKKIKGIPYAVMVCM